MDAAGSTETSRTPQEPDLLSLCRSLNQRGAKYLVIGGFAMRRLGMDRGTEDIDLLIQKAQSNQDAVIDALAELPDGVASELRGENLIEDGTIRIIDEITVDLMFSACGVDYEEAETMKEYVTLQGVRIPFASAELMLRMKKGMREKDAWDRNFLLHLLHRQNNPIDEHSE